MKKLTEQEIERGLADLQGWQYTQGCLATSFEFIDFKAAFSIMTRIAFECEALNHHPEWNNVYNTLNIFLRTHDSDGVTTKDFELARAIEGIVYRQ